MKDFLERKPKSFVYFLFSGSECVYVGQTIDPRGRIASHLKTKEFDGIYLLGVKPSQRDRVEKYWIKKLKPKYNTTYTTSPMRSLVVLLPSRLCRLIERDARKRSVSVSSRIRTLVSEYQDK